ncbi:MAG: AraC family transcriptional regulator [Victivallaceae bacterium]|nr:AraC family transcriptional regulator [Victivallaceae bacterium]
MLTTSLKISDDIDLEIDLLHVMMATSPKRKKVFGPLTMPYYMLSYVFQAEYHIYGENWDDIIREREAVLLHQGETIKTTYHHEQPAKAIQIVFRLIGKTINSESIFPRFIKLTDNRNIMEISLKRCLHAYESQHFDLAKEEFLTIILELLKINAKHKIDKYSSHVQHAIEYINKHFLGQPARETIAKFCQLNPMYLSTLFRKETGQSMKEYINRQRILHAKELISDTDHTISEIADTLSMDIFSFSRLFKKLAGISPSSYSKIYRL